MGISLWQIIIVLFFIVIPIWLYGRILNKAGYSRWWVILLFVPLVNLIMIWVFAYARWPNLEQHAVKNKVTDPSDEGDSKIHDTYQSELTEPVRPFSTSSDETSHQTQPTAKGQQASYIRRHWRGELTLPVSYWINGFLLNVIITLLVFVPWGIDIVGFPKLYSVGIIFMWLSFAAITIWQLVGIWRSAGNYMSQGKSSLWGNLAKVAVILSLIRAMYDFSTIAIPQISEYGKIASGHDPIGSYQLRVLRDATELEFSGAIIFGLADDIKRTLDAHPTIHTIHLNSDGGRVAEARKLRGLVDTRQLSTYTSSGCFSACTLVYVAGKRRLIAPDASLGFHQYSFPGVTQSEFISEYELDKQDWISRGFPQSFVDRAFSTPSDDMWFPTHKQLFEWNIITGYPEDNEVGISGIRLQDINKLEEVLSDNPVFSALKKYDPENYRIVISKMKTGFQQGKSSDELRHMIIPIVQSIYIKKLPYSSDQSIRSFIRLSLDQMGTLYAINSDLCYDYLYDPERSTETKIYNLFTEEQHEQEFMVMAEVIRSASEGDYHPPSKGQIDSDLTSLVESLSKTYGEDISMLSNTQLASQNKGRMCELAYDMYYRILQLPERDSGELARFMFANIE